MVPTLLTQLRDLRQSLNDNAGRPDTVFVILNELLKLMIVELETEIEVIDA